MEYVTAHGVKIPALGFGVFRMSEAEVEALIPAALETGFRHFDTAQIYGNEGRCAVDDDRASLRARGHRS